MVRCGCHRSSLKGWDAGVRHTGNFADLAGAVAIHPRRSYSQAQYDGKSNKYSLAPIFFVVHYDLGITDSGPFSAVRSPVRVLRTVALTVRDLRTTISSDTDTRRNGCGSSQRLA